MAKSIAEFLKDDRGATAIEYGLLAALLGVALIGAFTALGDTIQNRLYAGVKAELTK